MLGLFARHGAFCLDADRIVAELLSERDVLERIKRVAGCEVFEGNGKLIKKRLADRIFSDSALRKCVEDIIHPLVTDRINKELSSANAPVAIVEMPLLFEKGLEGMFQKTITVSTDEEVALERLEEAGFTREDALKRLGVQMPNTEKARRADYVIKNEGTKEETGRQAERVYQELLALSRRN